MKNQWIKSSGLGLMLVALLSGGCSTTPPSVAVREAVHRSEQSSTNRVALPLTAETREFLVKFLASGRNPGLDADGTLADPQATARFGGLLDLLSADTLAVSNLIADAKFHAAPAFKPWFPKPALRQVIDAREDFPPPLQPYAFLDVTGRHWWVFYHRQKRVTHVLVTRATPEKMER
jgi:hypothetical protein